MIITYHGLQCIKLTQGDLTLVFDPISKESKAHKPVSFGSDIALVSLTHPDMNGVAEVSRGEKVPFAVTGPGEYEVEGVGIHGFSSDSLYGKEERINTIYRVDIDGMHVVHLGALSGVKLSSEVKEELVGADVLFVPLSPETLSAKDAHTIAMQLEAKVIIPMGSDEKLLARFVKEAGGNGEKTAKLSLKRKDVSDREGDVVILTESGV